MTHFAPVARLSVVQETAAVKPAAGGMNWQLDSGVAL